VSEIQNNETRDLVLTRIMDVSREKLFRCWQEPELLKQWFVPKPWTIASADIDFRAGGSSSVVMQDPEGNQYPNDGIYLEVVPNEKIIFTDALLVGWKPSGKAFMVGEILFEDAGNNKTRYTATVRHWNAEDREGHEKMGFHEGWGAAADQLEALARTL
jgi:uncharacterized protein YndB with AHSA1/START domain